MGKELVTWNFFRGRLGTWPSFGPFFFSVSLGRRMRPDIIFSAWSQKTFCAGGGRGTGQASQAPEEEEGWRTSAQLSGRKPVPTNFISLSLSGLNFIHFCFAFFCVGKEKGRKKTWALWVPVKQWELWEKLSCTVWWWKRWCAACLPSCLPAL